MEVARRPYAPPTDARIVEFTLNIQLEDLDYFDPAVSGQFFSKDEQGLADEVVAENVRRIWALLKHPQPPSFTSVAARVAEARADSLACYGPAVLVLDRERIAVDTYVVNGDFKTLGYKLQEGLTGDILVLMRPNDTDLAAKLNGLARNGRDWRRDPSSSRLVGTYFEARVARPITLADLLVAYIPEGPRADAFERLLKSVYPL
ncbi:hypothetical protein [Nannocystis pusilla]|uniref:hypothetical protein n=1 Tax=Nannocystis pusilla TaxID=889268 RepID=UPI003DA4E892